MTSACFQKSNTQTTSCCSTRCACLRRRSFATRFPSRPNTPSFRASDGLQPSCAGHLCVSARTLGCTHICYITYSTFVLYAMYIYSYMYYTYINMYMYSSYMYVCDYHIVSTVCFTHLYALYVAQSRCGVFDIHLYVKYVK